MTDRMWAIDVEGSGKTPPEIVELAIVEMDGLKLTHVTKRWRLHPKNGISPAVSRIHGIWEEDVAAAPEIEDIADDLLMWLEDLPVVGHNVRVELELLGRALDDWRPTAAFDTLRVARRLLPNEEKHGLEHLGAALGLEASAAAATGGTAHSAPYDAVMSALLLIHLLEPLSDGERAQILAEADVLRGAQSSLL
jgi:DNA polymerase III subunit epsilon